MKVALVLACVGALGFASSKPLEPALVAVEEIQRIQESEEGNEAVDLKGLFDHFTPLIDLSKLAKYFLTKAITDPEVREVSKYLRSEKAKAIISHLMKEPEYAKLLQWFYDNGMTRVYEDLKRVHAYFGWDFNATAPAKTEVVVDAKFARTVQRLLTEATNVLPVSALATAVQERYQEEDPAAVALLQRFREPGLAEAWRRLKAVPEIQELGKALVEAGTEVEIFVVIVEAFFGWY